MPAHESGSRQYLEQAREQAYDEALRGQQN
jgi:hypothetical protein